MKNLKIMYAFLLLVSPYLKTLSMVSSTKLLHLLEAFSTPWFLFSSPSNHHLVFFLLEIFNNIIQYQFDGNSNLVYTIIRKRQVFHSLANLPSDYGTIAKSINKKGKPKLSISTSQEDVAETAMEGNLFLIIEINKSCDHILPCFVSIYFPDFFYTFFCNNDNFFSHETNIVIITSTFKSDSILQLFFHCIHIFNHHKNIVLRC